MNKNMYRFTGAFVALLGLAYLGHKVVVRTPATAAAPAHVEAAAAAAPGAAAAPVAANTKGNAYPVYPDKETESLLGLSYGSFTGDFVNGVMMTPLPPNSAGRTTLRIKGQGGAKLSFKLNDMRCASPVHIVVTRIDDKQAIENRPLTAASPEFAIPFDKQGLPHMLVDARMDDKAANNYYCGVVVSWGG